MSHTYNIEGSRPLDRSYNEVGVNKGEDVTLSVPIDNDDWIDSGYNLTIYDESEGTTLASVALDNDPEEIIVNDFSFDTTKALVVVEDRSNINDIDIIDTVAYLYFAVFNKNATVATKQGTIFYTNADDSTTWIPFYSDGFNI